MSDGKVGNVGMVGRPAPGVAPPANEASGSSVSGSSDGALMRYAAGGFCGFTGRSGKFPFLAYSALTSSDFCWSIAYCSMKYVPVAAQPSPP